MINLRHLSFKTARLRWNELAMHSPSILSCTHTCWAACFLWNLLFTVTVTRYVWILENTCDTDVPSEKRKMQIKVQCIGEWKDYCKRGLFCEETVVLSLCIAEVKHETLVSSKLKRVKFPMLTSRTLAISPSSQRSWRTNPWNISLIIFSTALNLIHFHFNLWLCTDFIHLLQNYRNSLVRF